jgi:hypothetical protein
MNSFSQWKGKTQWKEKSFTQIVMEIAKNDTVNDATYGSNLFRALPNKVFRKEIASKPMNIYNHSTKISIEDINSPGGVIMNSSSKNAVNMTNKTAEGLVNYLNEKDVVPNNTTEKPGMCTNVTICREVNARNRVRTSGIVKSNYNYNTNQYLHRRKKTFEQNQYTYPSNTVCKTSTNETTYEKIIEPTYYKRSNSKFKTQGAVSSSDRLLRLKVDNIDGMGALNRIAYGSSFAMSNGYNTTIAPVYNIKEQIGYSMTATPVILANGSFKKCSVPPRVRR